MTDKQMYATLEKFLNEHSIAKGGNIQVKITPYCMQQSPKDPSLSMKHEDCIFLSELYRGAWNFLLWQRRNKRRK